MSAAEFDKLLESDSDDDGTPKADTPKVDEPPDAALAAAPQKVGHPFSITPCATYICHDQDIISDPPTDTGVSLEPDKPLSDSWRCGVEYCGMLNEHAGITCEYCDNERAV